MGRPQPNAATSPLDDDDSSTDKSAAANHLDDSSDYPPASPNRSANFNVTHDHESYDRPSSPVQFPPMAYPRPNYPPPSRSYPTASPNGSTKPSPPGPRPLTSADVADDQGFFNGDGPCKPVQFPPSEAPKPLPPPPPMNIGKPWATSLFDCGQNQTNALMTACFPCVTFGQIAEMLDEGETSCLVGSLIHASMGLALCTCWILGSSYRQKLRKKYNLVQAPAEDWTVHLFCPCCALSQEFRELQNRGIDPALGWMGYLAQQQATATVPPPTQSMQF